MQVLITGAQVSSDLTLPRRCWQEATRSSFWMTGQQEAWRTFGRSSPGNGFITGSTRDEQGASCRACGRVRSRDTPRGWRATGC
jgi:hypothetical protein